MKNINMRKGLALTEIIKPLNTNYLIYILLTNLLIILFTDTIFSIVISAVLNMHSTVHAGLRSTLSTVYT